MDTSVLGRFKEMQKKLKDLEGEANKAQTRVGDLERQVKKTSSQNDTLTKENAAMKQAVTINQKKLATVENEKSQWSQKQESLKKEVTALKAQASSSTGADGRPRSSSSSTGAIFIVF